MKKLLFICLLCLATVLCAAQEYKPIAKLTVYKSEISGETITIVEAYDHRLFHKELYVLDYVVREYFLRYPFIEIEVSMELLQKNLQKYYKLYRKHLDDLENNVIPKDTSNVKRY